MEVDSHGPSPIPFDEGRYESLLSKIFVRFPSVQKSDFGSAYKPGLDRMVQFASLLGDPHKKYGCLHVGGTNGKGSVSNMFASVLKSCGFRVGLYTSPHIVDFRERMRVDGVMPSKEWVYDFLVEWFPVMDELDLSFFEITTGMAMKYFEQSGCDYAVIEVGLGGRLDSTNIITPMLSVVTTIGLDHTDLIGDTLGAIAYQKAGIFKSGVPALVGDMVDETAPVFSKVAREVGCPLYDAASFHLDTRRMERLLSEMDLRGDYQKWNLRTVLCGIDILRQYYPDLDESFSDERKVDDGIIHTARSMHFHGRWERVHSSPDIIVDIAHNAHALRGNFRSLEGYLDSGTYSSLTIVYAVMADKDLPSIIPLMPRRATYVFCTPRNRRAMASDAILDKVRHYREESGMDVDRLYRRDDVGEALSLALSLSEKEIGDNPLIYVGGSTFAVSEALGWLGMGDDLG